MRSSKAAASGHNRREQEHKVRIVFQFQTMALAFETMAAEQRETARLATTRRRNTWKKDTELERHLYSTAEVTAITRTEFEDVVVAAVKPAAAKVEKKTTDNSKQATDKKIQQDKKDH